MSAPPRSPRGAARGGTDCSRTAAEEAPPCLTEQLRKRVLHEEAAFRDRQDHALAETRRQALELATLQRQRDSYEKELRQLRIAEMTNAIHQPLRLTVGVVAGAGPGVADEAMPRGAGLRVYRDPSAVRRRHGEELERRRGVLRTLERDLADMQKRLVELRVEADEVALESRRAVPRMAVVSEVKESAVLTRKQLQGLEDHLSKALGSFATALRTNKQKRVDIDRLQTERDRFERLYDSLESRVLRQRKEMAFVMEVCNLACEERDSYLELLGNLEVFVDDEAARYQKTFEELDALLHDDEDAKGLVRGRIHEKEVQLAALREDRAAAERQNHKDEAEIEQLCSLPVSEGETIPEQLQQLQAVYAQISRIAGVEAADQVIQFGLRNSDADFRMFAELTEIKEEIVALQAKRKQLLAKIDAARTGDEDQRHRFQAMKELGNQLIADEDEQQRCAWTVNQYERRFSVVVDAIDRIFSTLRCSTDAIVEKCGAVALTRESVELYLAGIENRLEEYLVTWNRISSGNLPEFASEASRTPESMRLPTLPIRKLFLPLSRTRKGVAHAGKVEGGSNAMNDGLRGGSTGSLQDPVDQKHLRHSGQLGKNPQLQHQQTVATMLRSKNRNIKATLPDSLNLANLPKTIEDGDHAITKDGSHDEQPLSIEEAKIRALYRLHRGRNHGALS